MATTRDTLVDWVLEALQGLGGSARIPEVAKFIWEHHEADLRAADEPLFYTWQYDIRWAAQKLRDQGLLGVPGAQERGLWILKSASLAP